MMEDEMLNRQYGGNSNPSAPMGAIGALARPATMQERCALAVKRAEAQLAAVKRAQEILSKNPDLEELLNIMQNAHF